MAGEAVPELTRVLFVDHVGEMGGAEHSLLLLVRGLPDHGFEPHVVLPSSRGPLGRALEAAGVMAHEAPDLCVLRRDDPRVLLRLVRGRAQLARIARVLAPQVVHANGDMAMAFAAGLAGGPWRVVWHVRDLRDLGPLGGYLTRRSYLRVAPSRAAAERYGFTSSPMDMVVPNGVDIRRFRTGLPREPIRELLGIPLERVACLCVGQDVPWKRLDDFVALPGEGYDRVLVTFPPPGSATPAREFGPQRGLHVLPYRDDIDLVYAAADVLVHCAEREAFGRTIVEAMACGLPVVAVRAGGPAEIVEDGVSGLLVPPRDPGALARAVDSLVSDPELRSRFAAAARRRAEQFTAERHVAAMVGAYRTILGGGPA